MDKELEKIKKDDWNADAHFCKEDADRALSKIRDSKF
jgi:hypothetical protein